MDSQRHAGDDEMNQADDLTAERAAIALLEQMGLYGHPAASQFIGDILAALQTTRQEALREAKVIITQAATWTPQSVVAILDRLAREGVK